MRIDDWKLIRLLLTQSIREFDLFRSMSEKNNNNVGVSFAINKADLLWKLHNFDDAGTDWLKCIRQITGVATNSSLSWHFLTSVFRVWSLKPLFFMVLTDIFTNSQWSWCCYLFNPKSQLCLQRFWGQTEEQCVIASFSLPLEDEQVIFLLWKGWHS